jgi:hypothetical protein
VHESELESWLPDPAMRIAHARASDLAPDRLWAAAQATRLDQTRLLGRLVRWRIPGVAAATTFRELFAQAPFCVLGEDERWLLSGLVGRIWTLRRDYPQLAGAVQFREWRRPGTAKVLFAHWAEERPAGGGALRSEARVQAYGIQGRLGLASVRPLISGFHHLISTDAMATAVRLAERG